MVKSEVSNLQSSVRFCLPAYSPVAQLVEQVTVNHPVPGSSPGGGVCHHSTVVVQGFCKAKVGSSNLSDGIDDLLYINI